MDRSTPECLKAGMAVSSISWSGKRGHNRGWNNVQLQRRREEAPGDGESEEDGRVRKTAARKEGAEKRNEEPNVRDDLCLPISAASP